MCSILAGVVADHQTRLAACCSRSIFFFYPSGISKHTLQLRNFPTEMAIFYVNSLSPVVFISIEAPSKELTVKSVQSQRRPCHWREEEMSSGPVSYCVCIQSRVCVKERWGLLIDKGWSRAFPCLGKFKCLLGLEQWEEIESWRYLDMVTLFSPGEGWSITSFTEGKEAELMYICFTFNYLTGFHKCYYWCLHVCHQRIWKWYCGNFCLEVFIQIFVLCECLARIDLCEMELIKARKCSLSN